MVCRLIGRGSQQALDDYLFEIYHYHVVDLHGGVVLAAWFDRKDPTLRLSDADITEAQINQFVFLQ